MTTIIFVHGWGFDHRVWDAVRQRLDSALPIEMIDLGFFGTPQLANVNADADVIAVGHSLGACWWLGQSSIPWRRLLMINGFPRFTEAVDYRPAVAARVLARMRAQFARDPSAVLTEFRTVCGAPLATIPAGLDATRLGDGLGWLADWDGRAQLAQRAADIFALASDNDPIVPAAMTCQSLAGLPAAHLTLTESTGHVLPLTAPDLLAQHIEAMARP